MEELSGHIGSDVEVRIEFCESIPMVRTGKQQGSISLLDLSVADPGFDETVTPDPLIRERIVRSGPAGEHALRPQATAG